MSGYITSGFLVAGSLALIVAARDLPVRLIGWVIFTMAVVTVVLQVVAHRMKRRETATPPRHEGGGEALQPLGCCGLTDFSATVPVRRDGGRLNARRRAKHPPSR